jgi:thioredoxin 2
MSPIFERAACELEPRARFVVNVDDNPAAAARLGVRGITALFARKSGTAHAHPAGVVGSKLLASWVDHLSRPPT